jgi:uncharacterized protein
VIRCGEMARRTRLEAVFQRIVALRWPILVVFGLLVPLAAYQAAHIPADGSIGSLVMPSDPDYAATRAFQRIFPEGQRRRSAPPRPSRVGRAR